MENFFKLKERGTTVGKEVIAKFTVPLQHTFIFLSKLMFSKSPGAAITAFISVPGTKTPVSKKS